jgi:hypothetical protein
MKFEMEQFNIKRDNGIKVDKLTKILGCNSKNYNDNSCCYAKRIAEQAFLIIGKRFVLIK